MEKVNKTRATEESFSENDGENRFNKLLFDPKASQIERRERILRWQKDRRDNLVFKLRLVQTESFTDDEEGGEMNVEESDAPRFRFKDKSLRKSKRYSALGIKIQRSEWLLEKPGDLEDRWLGVYCPVGNRCLVFAAKGKTRVISRRGMLVGTIRSDLPGGSNTGNYDGPVKGITILDCIWNEESKTFYVLDMMCWNSVVSSSFEAECRLTMMKHNITENPGLDKQSSTNEFPFVPLNFFSADSLQRELYGADVPFTAKIDGLLLFHKESFYIYEGSNPLCLWIELCDVPEFLHLDVSEDVIANSRSTGAKMQKELLKAKTLDESDECFD